MSAGKPGLCPLSDRSNRKYLCRAAGLRVQWKRSVRKGLEMSRALPARATRGKRQAKDLTKEELEADEEFWNQEAWQEKDDEDESVESEDEDEDDSAADDDDENGEKQGDDDDDDDDDDVKVKRAKVEDNSGSEDNDEDEDDDDDDDD